MTLSAYWLHLRPRSWPIVFAHYVCGALILLIHAPADLLWSSAWRVLLGGVLWTICLNGGTLALNSAFDRDEGDIGYLDNPPPVPKHLAIFAGALLLAGAGLARAAMPSPYAWLMFACVVLSVLYSVPPIRLKAVAGADLIVNMLGYGAATIGAGACATGLLPFLPPQWAWRIGMIAAGFAALFGAFYPMTQIYQIPEDRARGDQTLAIALGARGSLVFALVLEVLALGLHLGGLTGGGFFDRPSVGAVALVLVQGIAWLVFTLDWLRRADRYPQKQGMYRALWLWALSDIAIVIAYGWGIR